MLNVGDRVKVRHDLEVNYEHNIGIIPEMIKFAGKETEIIRAHESLKNCILYRIKADNMQWFWSDDMFEE